MAFKVLVWNSDPLATDRTNSIVAQFGRVFGARNVVFTRAHSGSQGLSHFKCVLLLFPSPPGSEPSADWRRRAADTDAFLAQLQGADSSRVRIVPVIYQPSDLSWIREWHPAFAGVSKRQAAVLNDQAFTHQLRLLVQDIRDFARNTRLRRLLPHALVVAAVVGFLAYLAFFFASYSAQDINVEMVQGKSFRLDGMTLGEDQLIPALNKKTYWRKNDPYIVLHVSESAEFGAVSAVSTKLRKSGYNNIRVALPPGK